MYYELLVKNGTQEYTVFIQNGFYTPFLSSTPVHKHNYAEIHLTTDDTLEFDVGREHFCSGEGNLIIIPPNTLHRVVQKEQPVYHTAFQIDCAVQDFAACHVSEQTVLDFLEEIKKSKNTGDYTVVAAYIGLFCSYLKLGNPPRLIPITDYGFLIREFFSKHYNEDLCLADLAKLLHLSERQTERLVIKHMGDTFRNAISTHRIEMAKHLAEYTDLSMAEIARSVGYQSYAGFWKAMKKTAK